MRTVQHSPIWLLSCQDDLARSEACGQAVMFCLGSIDRASLKVERPLAALTIRTRIANSAALREAAQQNGR